MNNLSFFVRTIQSPLFWLSIGVLIFFMGTAYMTFFFNERLNPVFSFLGFIIIVVSFIFTRDKAIELTGFLKAAYLSFLVVTFFIIARGFLDYNAEVAATMNIRRDITYYLSPLLLLFPFMKYRQRYIFYVCMLSCVLGGFFLATQWHEIFIENAVQDMGFFNWRTVRRASVANSMVIPALLYFMWRGTQKKHVLVIFCVAICAVAGSLLSGRRSSSFVIIMFFMFYMIVNRGILKKRFVIIMIAAMVVAFNLDYIVSTFSHQFDFFLSRARIDSRSPVEIAFKNDMDWGSWLFGRGMLGTYVCPSNIDFYHRPMIETGYLHMILKGVIYLIPYLILLLSTAYRGIFKSNNAFTKCLGYYVLAHIFLLYPGGHISLNLQFLLVWYAVKVCNSRQCLRMTDREWRAVW